MDHLAYYNTGCEPARGLGRPKVWARRLLRKLLFPASRRLVEILASLCRRLDVGELEVRELQVQLDDLRRRHEDHSARLNAAVAFGWDYVALTRRLAALEEHVDTLLTAQGEPGAVAGSITPGPAADFSRSKVG